MTKGKLTGSPQPHWGFTAIHSGPSFFVNNYTYLKALNASTHVLYTFLRLANIYTYLPRLNSKPFIRLQSHAVSKKRFVFHDTLQDAAKSQKE